MCFGFRASDCVLWLPPRRFPNQLAEHHKIEVLNSLDANAALADVGLRQLLAIFFGNVLCAVGRASVERDTILSACQSKKTPFHLLARCVGTLIRPIPNEPDTDVRLQLGRGSANEVVQELDLASTRFFELGNVLARRASGG